MEYKKQFPVFDKYKDLSYLDNAATTQKPNYVIEQLDEALKYYSGNPHRGAHKLSVEASRVYDEARKTVKEFVHADKHFEVIFNGGTTEGLNIVASSLDITKDVKGRGNIVISISSHHSNILPWQRKARENHLDLVYMYSDDEISKIDENTVIVSFPLIANADGTRHDYKSIVKRAREVGAIVVVDAAQAVGHMRIDAVEIDADFIVFSAHKMFALTGFGVTVARRELLEKMQPFYLGGDMIEYVEEQSATFAEIPSRFEAGTQNLYGAVSIKAAIEFINDIGLDQMIAHEKQLYRYAHDRLSELDFVDILTKDEGSILAFNVKDVHPHDVSSILDSFQVAIRTGHHCAQPYIKRLGFYSTCRLSLSIYNTKEDIDVLVEGLMRVKEIFHVR